MLHKYVSIAVLNYNTPYHASTDCEPSRVFLGRLPYNVLDLKMGTRPQKNSSPDSQIAQDVLEQLELSFQDVRKKAIQAFFKYKAYYDISIHCLKFQTSRLSLRLTSKSGSPRKQNPLHRFSVGWTLYYWKGVTEQQLFGTRNWHQ